MIEKGYCQCGCGKKTKISDQTIVKRGWVKGEPRFYLLGHSPKLAYMTLEERFWQKVIKRGEDECWFWVGAKNKKGYGQFHPTRITSTSANRMSWKIHFGEISDDIFVLHTCDFPECTNPKHLFLGTHQDNMDDMVAKGRSKGFEKGHIVRRVKGEETSWSVMTDLLVIEARQRHKVEKIGYKKLAKEYGVSGAAMHCVLRRKTWKHVPEVASGR